METWQARGLASIPEGVIAMTQQNQQQKPSSNQVNQHPGHQRGQKMDQQHEQQSPQHKQPGQQDRTQQQR